MSDPVVSAVIPTRNRSGLVGRAVRSALGQTYASIDVVVVIDGSDLATEFALQQIEDPRLRVIVLPRQVGGCEARNAGIEAARGSWIALLDDDDEWLPEKIEFQVRRAMASPCPHPIVSSQVFARFRAHDFIWPRLQPYEPLSEYLLARNSWSYGEGLLQTTTLLAPRELFLSVPFRPGLRRHQDLDWVLRAVKREGVAIEFIRQPLAVWYQSQGSKSVSTAVDWKTSLDWIDSISGLATERAYAGFIATHVAPQARQAGDWHTFTLLLKRILTRGKPRLKDVGLFLAMWFVPQDWRRALRRSSS